jgi:tetratricopeptide (TPR) repeat protein
MTTTQQPFALYNPALLPPDVLLAEFTARRPMLDTLLGIVRGNHPGHPPQHCLLIGARGAGKTTTLWAVAHSVARDVELGCKWQPVVFDEESRRVGDLADFWLECIRQWEHAVRAITDKAKALLEEAPVDIEERAKRTFMDMVERSGRRALLLIDNLNDLLGSIHDAEPLHRLRAFLMKESRVMIIGAATRYFDEVTSVDKPFHDFFRNFELRPLSLEETQESLVTLAQRSGDDVVKRALEERGGTLRTLHLLTGGNPRLIKTFYRLLKDGLHGEIRADLERLLDEFTPYFKAIVDALPGQQQRIFDAIALAWDPVEVSAIATVTRIPSNQVSAQIRALVKNGMVSEAAGRPKRKSYLLGDRFSNIHYLMRHGRAARNRFDWFVAMVQLVFSEENSGDLLARFASDAAKCGPDGQRDARAILESALNRAENAESRRRLLHATLRESWDSSALESLGQWFDTERAKQDLPEIEIVTFCGQMPPALRKKLGFKPTSASWWVQLTDFLEEKEAWELAEACYRKAIELDPQDPNPWCFLGNLLADSVFRYAEAESAFRSAIEVNPSYALGWINLGNLLANVLDRPSEAESAFRKAIEVDSASAFAWGSLGYLLGALGRLKESEAAYRKGVEVDPKDAFLWDQLGHVLRMVKRFGEAEAAYRKAIEADPTYAHAWTRLADLLAVVLNRPKEAEAALLSAKTAFLERIRREPNNPYLRFPFAQLLSKRPETIDEARFQAARGIELQPDEPAGQEFFVGLCGGDVETLRSVIPTLAKWCAAHPKATQTFQFTVVGFIQLSHLTKPADVLALLDALPDATPFETLRDAFRAHGAPDYLHRLAPERRSVAIELLRQISNPSNKVAGSKPKKTRQLRTRRT